jgi:hypothetical protein
MFVYAFRGSLLLALAGVLLLSSDVPLRSQPATAVQEVNAPDRPEKPADPQPLGETGRIRKLLSQNTDKLRQGIDPGQSLKDVLDFLGRSHGLTFRVDHAAFKMLGQDSIEEKQLPTGLPGMRDIPLATILGDLLLQLEPHGAFMVRKGYIAIVPLGHTMAEFTMREPVEAEFDKTPLQDALRELTEHTGTSIILDARRAGEKAKTPLTATLHHVQVGTAVKLLANMAELKAVMVDNAIFVTTEENAKKLEEEGSAAPIPQGAPAAAAGA